MKGEVRTTRESISHNIGYAFHIVQGAIQMGQVYTPFCLSRIEMRLLEKVDERVVVGVHIHMGVVKVGPPKSECMHNGKHFLIMNRAVHLCRVELSRLEGDGLEAVALILHERSTYGKVGCIGVKSIREGVVREDGRRGRS